MLSEDTMHSLIYADLYICCNKQVMFLFLLKFARDLRS